MSFWFISVSIPFETYLPALTGYVTGNMALKYEKGKLIQPFCMYEPCRFENYYIFRETCFTEIVVVFLNPYKEIRCNLVGELTCA